MVSTRTRTPPPVQANGEVTLAAVKDKFQPPATHTARVQVLRQARAPTAARASPAPAKAMPTPHLKTAAAAKPAPPVTRAVRARPIDVDRKLLVIKPGDMRTLARFLENDPQGVDNMAELLQDLCKEDSIYNRQPDLEDEEDHQASGDADGGGGGKATSAAAARSAVEVPGFRLVNDGGAAGGSAGGSEEAGEAGRGKGKGGKRRAVKAMRFEQDDIPQLSYSGYDCDSEDEAFILRANASYRAALAATAKPTAKGGGKKRVSLRRGVQPPIPGAASQGLCAADTSNPLTTSIMEQMLASLEKENFTVAQNWDLYTEGLKVQHHLADARASAAAATATVTQALSANAAAISSSNNNRNSAMSGRSSSRSRRAAPLPPPHMAMRNSRTARAHSSSRDTPTAAADSPSPERRPTRSSRGLAAPLGSRATTPIAHGAARGLMRRSGGGSSGGAGHSSSGGGGGAAAGNGGGGGSGGSASVVKDVAGGGVDGDGNEGKGDGGGPASAEPLQGVVHVADAAAGARRSDSDDERDPAGQLYLDVITPERAQQLLLPHISGAFHSGQGGGGSCNSAVTELVSQVYQYWVAKRRALLGPLLRCYDHFPLLENWQRVGHSAFTPCNWSAAAIGPAVSEPANETTAAAAVAGTEAGGGEQRVLRNEEGGGGEQQELTAEVQERLRVYRDMRRLRQELDRVRLVADLARRREKLKRDRCRTSAAWWTALITAAGECDAQDSRGQDTLRRIASIVAAAPQTDRQFACGGVEPNAPLQQQQQQQRQPKQEKAEPVPVTKPQPQQQSHKRAPAAPPPPQQSRKRAAAPLPREPPPKLPEGCTEAQAVKLLKGTNWEVEWRRGGSGGRHMAVVRKNSAPAAAVQPQPTHHRRAPVSMKAFNMWTPEEDALLLRGVAAHGHGHWADVRESTGLQRNSAQMNQRFARLLRNSNLEAQKALMARPPRSVDSSIARHMTGSSANGAGSSSGTSKKSRNGDSGGAGDKSSDGGGGSRKRKGGSGGAAEQGSSNSSSSGADAGSARAKVPKIGNTSAGSPVRKGSVVARGASVTNAGGSTRASKHASGSDSRAPSTGNAASARKPAIRKGGDGTGVSGSRSGSKGGTGPAGALRNSNSADSRAALRRADALARRAGKGRRRV